MPSYHIYLISSLPMLHFGAKPPFSIDKFLETSQDLIPKEDFTILRKISLRDESVYEISDNNTLRQWKAFDTALRNELVRIRASRKRLDPVKYLRHGGDSATYIAHIAITAYRSHSPLEAEKILDQERWYFLDELATGHYFDLDFLIVYALKLEILEKWDSIARADKISLMEKVLA